MYILNGTNLNICNPLFSMVGNFVSFTANMSNLSNGEGGTISFRYSNSFVATSRVISHANLIFALWSDIAHDLIFLVFAPVQSCGSYFAIDQAKL
jgi:hypothetical protein